MTTNRKAGPGSCLDDRATSLSRSRLNGPGPAAYLEGAQKPGALYCWPLQAVDDWDPDECTIPILAWLRSQTAEED